MKLKNSNYNKVNDVIGDTLVRFKNKNINKSHHLSNFINQIIELVRVYNSIYIKDCVHCVNISLAYLNLLSMTSRYGLYK